METERETRENRERDWGTMSTGGGEGRNGHFDTEREVEARRPIMQSRSGHCQILCNTKENETLSVLN